MFEALDLFLLDRCFEPLSALIHKRFNISNYTIAKVLLMTSSAVIGIAMIINILHGQIFGLGTTLYAAYIAWPALKLAIRLEEQNVRGFETLPNFRIPTLTTEPGRVADRRRSTLILFIVVALVFSLLQIIMIVVHMKYGYAPHAYHRTPAQIQDDAAMNRIMGAFVLFLLITQVGLYFLSCTPRLPRKHRMKVPALFASAGIKAT